MSKKENIALLLNVSTFLDERPAMTAFSQEEILEGIYTAFNLINGECANLPLKVLDYNAPAMTDPPTPVDTTNELYRTDFEIDQFRQAVITQTQYTLNMGNDFSQGSASFSTGGLNASIQRPEKRDILAPGVLKFLQNARLYSLQVYSSYSNLQKPANYGDCDLRNVFVTYENGDKRYVHQYQEGATIGSIAVIDNNRNVSFQNPNTVTFKGMDANRILDTDGNYKKIHDIANLAFYGPDGQDATTHNELMDYVQVQKIYSPNFTYKSGDIVATYDSNNNKLNFWKSNQHNNRGNDPVNGNTSFFWWTPIIDNNIQAKTIWDPVDQVYKLINQFNVEYFGGLTKDQIYSAINASGTSWNATFTYRRDFVVIFVDSANALGWYQSLQDNNIGHNPETDTTWWKKLPTPIVDVNDIILQITPYLDQEITKKVGAEIQKYATQSVGEYEGTVFKFTDDNAFNTFIAQNPKLTANMFEDVPFDYYTKTETDAAYQQLDTRLQGIDTQINTNTQNITTNTNNITTNTRNLNDLDTKVDGVINGLQNGNLINYTGVWSSTKTYSIGQCVTHNDKWYVSNLNNNTNHTPQATSDTWWELLSEPAVNLTDYYNKTESDLRYAQKASTNYFLAPQYVKGSLSLGADNSTPRIEIDGDNRRIGAASGRIQYQNCATPTLIDDCVNKEYVDNNFYNKTYINNNYYTKTQINNWDLQTYSGTLTQLLVGPQKGDTTGTGGFPIYKYAFKTSIKFTEQNWSNMCVLDFRFVNAKRQWVYVNPLFVFLDNGYINIEFITLDPNCYQTNIGAQVQIRVIKNSSYIG